MRFAFVYSIIFMLAIPAHSSEKIEFPAAKIKRVVLRNNAGSITVASTEKGKAVVEVDKKHFDKKNCSLIVKEEKGRLIVSSKSKASFWSKAKCQVDFKLLVPTKLALDIKSGSGDINIFGTEGTVEFQIGSGDVMINGQVTNLKGSTGSGNIDVTGLTGPVDLKSGSGDIELELGKKTTDSVNVRTGSGDIDITYAAAPIKGDVNLSTGSGDATVYLPTAAQIKTKFNTGLGDIVNQLGNQSDAPVKFVLNSGVGDLKILKTIKK